MVAILEIKKALHISKAFFIQNSIQIFVLIQDIRKP